MFKDVMHGIFDYIPNESSDQKLDKELLIKCYLKGYSSSSITVKRKLHPGREIYMKQTADPYLTSDLFDKPLVVWQTGNEQNELFIAPYTENINEGKYFHRHAFKQEHNLCCMNARDTLIGANNDRFRDIFNFEKECLDYFVDNFQSNNGKMASKIKQDRRYSDPKARNG